MGRKNAYIGGKKAYIHTWKAYMPSVARRGINTWRHAECNFQEKNDGTFGLFLARIEQNSLQLRSVWKIWRLGMRIVQNFLALFQISNIDRFLGIID